MKVVFIFSLLLTSLTSLSQNKGDLIVGKWMKIPKEDLIIDVYRANNEYQAKIYWSRDTISKPIGYKILNKLKYDTDDHCWEDGEVSDPRNDRTYSAVAKIKSDGTLEVLAYMGAKFLGTNKYFKRVTTK